MSSYDVVVIGGGHNGLVAAAYLARAGARIVVLERRPIVGGACVTEEPWPGFRINTYAYLAGMLRPRIVDELELRRYGYETIALEPEVFHPFPDGRSLTMWSDRDRLVSELAKFSAADARAYPKYAEYWETFRGLAEPLLLAPPAGLAELVARFGGGDSERFLRDLMLRSAADFLDDWFESEEIKAAFGFGATVGGFAGPRTPGTAYLLAHNALASLDGHPGAWGFAKGGMGRISEAIARSARSSGAEIRTSSTVTEIVVRDGRAAGVRLDDGTVLEGRCIASAVDVQQTVLRLVPSDAIDEGFRRRVQRFRANATTLKFNAALGRLPTFSAAPENPGPHHRASVELASSVDAMERAYDQAKFGAFSEPPFMEVLFQSAVDPSVAPPGLHTMTCSVKFAPRTLRAGSWPEAAPTAAETVLSTIEEYAPDIRECVTHAQVVTPADIEGTLGLSGGSCFQGDMTPDQMFALRPFPGATDYRLPLKGLYLCGASAHPGGAVTGAPGHNAARVILQDLGTSDVS